MLFMRYFNPRSREGSDPTAVFLLHFPSISIHAPARGATCPAGVFGRWRPLFQSTLPRGERQKLQYISTRTIAIFQSTLPRGERLETQKTSGSQSELSIHAPARGATYSPHEIKERLQINFNPRSREGSDEDVTTKVDSLEISIHAPARGATSTYQHTHYSTRISIHAPARGATDFSDFFKFFLRISIHAPARGATVDPFFGSLDHVISIHAPARGATFGTLRSIPAASLFQSTLPRGERLLCGANLKLVIQFQSTLPRGERRCRRRSVLYCSAFQSTLPRGERLEAYFA